MIVVSILLAFAVQAWWERQQERRLEVERLSALRIEVGDVVERLPVALATIQGTRAALESLIGQFPGGSLASGDSLIYWLSEVARPNDLDPPRTVLGDLVSSGGIQQVASDEVRRGIANYQLALDGQDESVQKSWEIWANRIQPYLEGRVSRVDRLRLGAYGAIADVPLDPSPFAPKYADLFADPVFESMLAERWFRLRQAEEDLVTIEEAGTELVRLIDDDLGR